MTGIRTLALLSVENSALLSLTIDSGTFYSSVLRREAIVVSLLIR